ncbi:rho guanine nucleotide exchange factor 40 isoform X1 [Anguilla anguilla]|uniref:rho guanine nucleotide exchange factor 40 isoform X1 n=1 Tax=Anguilla anguilla TaxID=7936 RepID=UPI0015AB7957|nr:rho guanine nucleotide exchange factor 40 isoform X1 [Anguilla anguilla]
MGSEAVEDCVQGALSSLYPPFESTAPPLLSQVFSVLESTYQHDSLRYLLDYFIPAKHLLQRLQQHACSQYLGCLFLHAGWPLCLGDRVVVQLSTLDWRLLRSTDFYLQVVPFSTRCPRLALKCLAPGGRNVQEVLVPESQHALVFTPEWLHCINKERGFQREGGGGLDTCLVSTGEGMVRLPWEEVVYPKFVSSPSPSSPCETDSWSWDEDEDSAPDAETPPLLRKHGTLGEEPAGEYVQLLEPRDGPEGGAEAGSEGGADGGTESRQRYLEMHGICKTKTLPLCRRGRGLRLRRGKAWAHGKHDPLGGRRGVATRRDSPHTPTGAQGLLSRPVPRVIDLEREGAEGPVQERRPGVGREREGANQVADQHLEGEGQSDEDTLSRSGFPLDQTERLLVGGAGGAVDDDPSSAGAARGTENTERPLDGAARGTENTERPLDGAARGTENTERPLDGSCRTQRLSEETSSAQMDRSPADRTSVQDKTTEGNLNSDPNPAPTTELGHGGILEDRLCLRGKEVKTAGFRAPRRKRKGKGGRGKAKSSGRGQGGRDTPHKPQGKAEKDNSPDITVSANSQSKQAQSAAGREEFAPANEETEGAGSQKQAGENLKVQSEILLDANSQSNTVFPDRCSEDVSSVNSPDQSDGSSCKTPPLLRELDPEVLQSGWLILTGTVDRMGRAVVTIETQNPPDGFQDKEVARVLTCYHAITRPSAKEKGVTVILDCRLSPPSDLCLSALKLFQDLAPGALGCVLVLIEEQQSPTALNMAGVEVHSVCGTGVLQQFVDRQQLPSALDGDFQHSHSQWLSYRLSLERLTEHCESALSLLEEAMQSLNTEPLPHSTKTVLLSVNKHRELMTGVLSDQRLTELQRVGGTWLASLTNGRAGLAQTSPDCRAALARTSDLYNSVDDALHRLVRVSNQRGRSLDALSRLAKLEEKLERCDREVEQVVEQVEEFRVPPLSLSSLALKQQKYRAFREMAMELQKETNTVLAEVENWAGQDWEGRGWEGLGAVLQKLPSVRDKLRNMTHCLSDCWTQMDTTHRLLNTLTEASQWCDAVCATPMSSSSSPLTSLPPIPPSRFHDARALAMDLGGGALLELWSRTLERYQQTLAQFKSRLTPAPPRPAPAPPRPASATPRPKAASSSSMWDLLSLQGEVDWEGEGEGGEGGLQSWGSLASLFRPQTCSTLKIGEDKKREGGGGGGGGGGKFLQALLHPAKKSPPEAPLPPKPPRRRNPSFDLQALLAPRRALAPPRPAPPRPAPPCPTEGLGTGSRTSPLSWLGRRVPVEPMPSASVGGGGRAGGVLIRGVEVSSKEVVDHTGSPRQHVLLSRTERETAPERPGVSAHSRATQLACRLLAMERQYVALLKGVDESYLPLLDAVDTPVPLRGQGHTLFSNWSGLSAFHSQYLLPAMEGAITQTLLLQDCFSKYKTQFLQYSHYIRTKPEMDSLLVSQATDFFKMKLPDLALPSPLAFPSCLQAPVQQLAHYCHIVEELAGPSPAPDSTLSTLKHIQQQGEDLRASDLIVGCPVPVSERGELLRQGELLVFGGARRRKSGVRRVFLYQHILIFTKPKPSSATSPVYNYKHSVKTGEMGLTQSVGEEGLRFEVWVRQASRTRDCLTLQAPSCEERSAWTHQIAQLLWANAIHNTELCLKESLCMGVSSKLLLDVTGIPNTSEQELHCLSERVQSSCSDSSSVGSQKEGGSPILGRHPQKHSQELTFGSVDQGNWVSGTSSKSQTMLETTGNPHRTLFLMDLHLGSECHSRKLTS